MDAIEGSYRVTWACMNRCSKPRSYIIRRRRGSDEAHGCAYIKTISTRFALVIVLTRTALEIALRSFHSQLLETTLVGRIEIGKWLSYWVCYKLWLRTDDRGTTCRKLLFRFPGVIKCGNQSQNWDRKFVWFILFFVYYWVSNCCPTQINKDRKNTPCMTKESKEIIKASFFTGLFEM